MAEFFLEKERVILNELSILINKLTSLSLKENHYLKNMELEKLEEFSEEKLALIFLMTKMKKQIQNDPIYQDNLLQTERDKIKKEYEILENLTKRNLMLTEYVMSSNRKILELLNKYYLGKGNKVVLYNNRGNKI